MSQTQTRYGGFFEDLANRMPYLKLAAEGQAGSGKTFTCALIAAGIHKRIGSEKPIVIFDTEKSSKFLIPLFKKDNIKVLVKPSRTLPDLVKTIQFCDEGNADILLIDSITHVWEDYLNAYQQKKGRKYIQFQDWNEIKPTWKREFSTRIVDARAHIIFTGRQGYTYDYEEINGKRELVKTGIKMKAEGETAYEPDVLLLLERYERILGDDKEVWREATVLKGRSQLLDGKTIKNPTYKDLSPEVEYILSDVAPQVNTESRPNDDIISDAEEENQGRRECRAMLERNETLLDKVASGTTKEAKALRAALKEDAYYGETSDTAIATLGLGELTEANNKLTEKAGLIARIHNGESRVYNAVPKAISAARLKYVDDENLGNVPNDKLKAYLDHMIEKARSGAKGESE